METERSLGLDVETQHYRDTEQSVARIAVVGVQGVTRDGSASTITRDCGSLAELEVEVERLRSELEDALDGANAALGGEVRTRSKPATARSEVGAAPAGDPSALRLSLEARVADLMTRDVQTVHPNDSLSVAKRTLDEGGFRHLVVLSEDGEIEGVLSHRDLFFGPLSWSLGQGQKAYEALLEGSAVKDVMHDQVVSVEATASLQDAARELAERKVGCLPVVEAGRLVGVVTEGDFVRLVADAASGSS